MANSKSQKRTQARKNAEVQKALKKTQRLAKAKSSSSIGVGKKGPSLVGQSKKKKK